jgi:hypothetical protein
VLYGSVSWVNLIYGGTEASMKIKKYLSFTALRKWVSSEVRQWPDTRRQESALYSIHDAVMSAFACMYFQAPSMLQFQQQMEEESQQNNLRTLFGVKNIPKTNALKEILDDQDSSNFNPIFKGIVQRLQRGKQLDQFKLYDGLTVCSIDGTGYHSSHSVHCDQCLTKHKDSQDKPTLYQHSALQAALMHPDMKQVIPIMAEPIRNSDGTQKQDCESNAAKRLIPMLRKQFPKMGLIITGDDLFSRQPMIECVLNSHYHFFFVAKPTSHPYMMEWLSAYDQLHEYRECDERGRTIVYQWMNDIPLHGGNNAIHVNYFCKKLFITDPNGKQRVYQTESWVTDLEVNTENVVLFTPGAKSRWKIENECFNTLKNQGYHLEHNYGHGEKHLAFNFYLLTLLAFLFHQIFELCDTAFQASRRKAGSKRNLWEKLRAFINSAIFESWEQLLSYFLNYAGYNIIDRHVVAWIPPLPP